MLSIFLMNSITFASKELDDEDLNELQYALFRDLNSIDGVEVSHMTGQPVAGERGALSGIGVVLKSVAPGAVTSVVNAFASRLSYEPEIDLDLDGIKLSTRNLGAEEFRSILIQVLQNK